MGYWYGLKINEGIHINTKDRSIDIIVRKIEGSTRKRIATFEINGVPDVKITTIRYNEGLVKLTNDVYIGVRSFKSRKDKVDVHFSTNYYLEKREYE